MNKGFVIFIICASMFIGSCSTAVKPIIYPHYMSCGPDAIHVILKKSNKRSITEKEISKKILNTGYVQNWTRCFIKLFDPYSISIT